MSSKRGISSAEKNYLAVRITQDKLKINISLIIMAAGRFCLHQKGQIHVLDTCPTNAVTGR